MLPQQLRATFFLTSHSTRQSLHIQKSVLLEVLWHADPARQPSHQCHQCRTCKAQSNEVFSSCVGKTSPSQPRLRSLTIRWHDIVESERLFGQQLD